MRVDVHCHIGQRCRPCQTDHRFSFEPAGDDAPYDAYFSDRINNGLGMRITKRLFGVPAGLSDREADPLFERTILQHILGATLIDRAVVLAFDQYHASSGETLGPRQRRGRFGSDLYVSNTYARALWLRHPRRILFGASIHPYRATPGMTALEMLDEVAAAGAVLVKWLPLAQNIDAEDERAIAFLRRAGEIGMPMLIHYGGERALGANHPEYRDPSGLLRTLNRLRRGGRMPPVIIAHVATPSGWPVGTGRFFRMIVNALTGTFADAPLYADISALALFSRARWLKRLARMPAVHGKLVYGSDFPVPTTPLVFRFRLGRRYRQIQAMPSWIDRDVAVKAAVGFGNDVLTRGSGVLAGRIAAADTISRSV